MKFEFNEHIEKKQDTKIETTALSKEIEMSMFKEDYSDEFDRICDMAERQLNDTEHTSQNGDKIMESFEDEISSVEKKSDRYIYFKGNADVNSDYGKGGGRQYFIQYANELKEKGNLVIVDQEKCIFNPETDKHLADIKLSNGYLVHYDYRNLSKEEISYLDYSTPEKEKCIEKIQENSKELLKEEIEYLDENTINTDGLTKIRAGQKHEDFEHPLGNQEDCYGEVHPDGWENAIELKEGEVYYQLRPESEDGSDTKSPYFTDKETIDSCRDKNGNIILGELMCKLQIPLKKVAGFDAEGNRSINYVRNYSIIQYKFKENADECKKISSIKRKRLQ